MSTSTHPSTETDPLLQSEEPVGNSEIDGPHIEDGKIDQSTTGTIPALKRILNLKLLAVMLCFFASGLSTTGIGALITGIESYYKIGDGQTAIIFPTGVAGYLVATLALEKTLTTFGWRGVALTAPCLRLISTVVIGVGLPFPVMLVGYFMSGFAIGLADSGFCAWGSNVSYANITQGFMHGSFSIGAVTGPVLAQSIARRDLGWYSFYRLLAVLSILEFCTLGAGFRRDDAAAYAQPASDESTVRAKHPLRTAAVWMCGLFFLIYVGVESSYSDWAIEYMKRVRHLDPSIASFSSSSFWIGMTFGRLTLGPVTERFGLVRCVSVYITISTIFQILFKWTDSAAASLVLLGANGFFLGPMFPSGVILLATKVPPTSNIGAIAAAAAMGQIGAASAPLAIGVLADGFGIGRMLDVVLGLSVVLLFMWIGFCRFPSFTVTTQLVG